MNRQQIEQILFELAEEAIPTRGDPWPAISSRLAWNKRPRQNRLHLAAGICLAVLVLLAGALVTPQGRAFAASVARFFVPLTDDRAPAPLAVTPTPLALVAVIPAGQSPQPTGTPAWGTRCGPQFDPGCTLQAAQRLVGFPLQQFASLPGNMFFQSASVEEQRVTAMYQCPDGCTLWLEQEKLDGRAVEPAPVGASAVVERVRVGEAEGEYVRGSYYGDQGGWNADSGSHLLRWQQGDVLYTLSAYQSVSSGPAALTLDRETLLALAQSLTPDLDLAQPLNPGHLTGIGDAQILAGFEVYTPGFLPEKYTFSFATYDPATTFVCLHYAYNGASYPSLFIRQSATAPLTDLHGYPGSELKTTPVRLEDADGEARYITGFAAPEDVCDGQQSIFRAAQVLLWRARGMSFEIYGELPSPTGGAGLSQEQLLAVAQSLASHPPTRANIPDLDHLPSLSSAAQIVGYAVKALTKLPVGSTLAFARVQGASALSVYTSVESSVPALSLYQCPASASSSPCRDLLTEIPAGQREAARVNGNEAVFATGSLGLAPGDAVYAWHIDDPGLTRRLYWRADGYDYLLLSTGQPVKRDILVAIAESLR